MVIFGPKSGVESPAVVTDSDILQDVSAGLPGVEGGGVGMEAWNSRNFFWTFLNGGSIFPINSSELPVF